MSGKTKADKTKTKTNKSNVVQQYAYIFNGGVLKQNYCIIGVGTDHQETTVFNELVKYYGKDIKGAYYKCSKTPEEINAGIKFKMGDSSLSEILYNKSWSDAKKILFEVTGVKCKSINVYTEKKPLESGKADADADADANADDESESESEDDNTKDVKPVENTKEKNKKKDTTKTQEQEQKETKSKSKDLKESKDSKN